MQHMPIAPGTLYLAAEWIIRLGALAIVPLRRSPAASRAWLLLIFFLPIAGLLLFLAIGNPRFPGWRTARFRKLRPYFAEVATRLDDGRRRKADGPAAALAGTLGFLPAVDGNRIELIDDYDAAIARLVADIDAARHSVHLLVYIFADDATGLLVVDALRRARERGVRCRVMFDPVGSHHWRRGIRRALAAAGVEVREALPFRLLGRRTRRDMRNHRKLFVIDDAIGYAGSQNIVAKDFRPGVINRELVARLTGPVVAGLGAVVAADWSIETGEPPAPPPPIPAPAGDARAQLLPSGADFPLEGLETLLVWQIHQAVSRVIIVTPYFIPDDAVMGAMRTAVARGVTVDLVVSAVVDQRLVNLAQCSFYDDLLVAGVGVHLFRDFLLHAKNISIDGRLAILGSSNVDLRSFQLNEEASLLLFDTSSITSVETIQHGYLAGSDTLDLATWRARPRQRKVIENVARLVSSLL
ncbi:MULTISPECIES: phospholipase D-like domain-containing protein [unclassified Sphingomonas]|uniref:phospholipase D-like domain-containing protein n=1 Tax=unclassified Sphingomonas TaxID=196159 RepID=UPI00226ADB87|nr:MULTISPECIES: phospholipase D-like domain-containing protein [unclassified Sphingomonas]